MDAFLEEWRQAEAARRIYIDGLAPWVQVWIGIMTWSIRASVLFAAWRREARWILIVGILTPLSAIVMRMVLDSAYPPGANHVVLWTPLAAYLLVRCAVFWRHDFGASEFVPGDAMGIRRLYWTIGGHRLFKLLFGVWLTGMLVILVASLIFDYRELAIALFGGSAS